MERLLIGLELFQSAGWILTLIALRRTLRANSRLERRNAVQARDLAMRRAPVKLAPENRQPFGRHPSDWEAGN